MPKLNTHKINIKLITSLSRTNNYYQKTEIKNSVTLPSFKTRPKHYYISIL